MSEVIQKHLSELRISDQNVRPGVQEKTEDWAEFVASVKAGLKEPLLIEGDEIIDGGMRFRALQEIASAKGAKDKDPLVPCIEEAKQEAVDQLVTSAITNLHRRNLTPTEWAGVVDRLKKMGLNQNEIAKKLMKSKGWVSMVKAGKAWAEHRRPPPPKSTEKTGEERRESFECPACGTKLVRRTGGVDLVVGQVRYEIPNQDNTDKPARRGKK